MRRTSLVPSSQLHFLARSPRTHPIKGCTDDEHIQKNGNQRRCDDRTKDVFCHQALGSRHLYDHEGKLADLRKPGGHRNGRSEGVAEDPNQHRPDEKLPEQDEK